MAFNADPYQTQKLLEQRSSWKTLNLKKDSQWVYHSYLVIGSTRGLTDKMAPYVDLTKNKPQWSLRLTKLPKWHPVIPLVLIFSKLWDHQIPDLRLHEHPFREFFTAAKSRQSCPTLCDPIDGSPQAPRPWDPPGKNTGVGCHFLLQCMKVKSESEVAQSCSTPSYPMDCSAPGSSIHGIFQARVLEWGAIAFEFFTGGV